MLIDHIKLNIKAGDGGSGVVRWRKEKGIPYGGPAGGDGGKGGDVYFIVFRDIHTLSDYARKIEWQAENGEAGKKKSMHGGNGKDLYLRVPLGSIIYNKTYNIIYNATKEDEKFLVLRGGDGGYGNEKFKSSTNRAPEEFTKGKRGEDAEFEIELKLIADVGIIGLPNAGKSSLINALTNAGAKTADYAFTTLEPNLGAYYGYVLADIPGLIEGASAGKGLGFKFLRHITSTNILLHLVSVKNEDVKSAYKTIRNELKIFDKTLLQKKEIIVLSRIDEIEGKDEKEKNKNLLKKVKDLAKTAKLEEKDIIILSLFEDKYIKNFEKILLKNLNEK